MKFLRSSTTRSTLMLAVLLGFGITGWQPLWAEEFVNISEFQDCRAIKRKGERLLCYDTIADGGVFNEQQVRQVQQETFGAKDKKTEVAIDSLNVTVVRIEQDARGLRYFFTDGGQVWKQQNPGGYPSTVPFEAEVKSGMMGSFFLVNEGGRGIRVKRVK